MDVSLIQEFDQKIQEKNIHLFPLKITLRSGRKFRRPEMPVHFYLKEERSVRVEIVDEAGKLVKVIELEGERGINTAAWDVTRDVQDPRARFATPGKYTVNVIAGEDKATGTVEIKHRRRR